MKNYLYGSFCKDCAECKLCLKYGFKPNCEYVTEYIEKYLKEGEDVGQGN